MTTLLVRPDTVLTAGMTLHFKSSLSCRTCYTYLVIAARPKGMYTLVREPFSTSKPFSCHKLDLIHGRRRTWILVPRCPKHKEIL